LFWVQSERYQSELMVFRSRTQFDVRSELQRLAMLNQEVSEWLQNLRERFISQREDRPLSHSDKFFIERILEVPARRHAAFARELTNRVHRSELPTREFLERQYARLADLFNVQFSSFERKKYQNLSHEANKAMNLNSYIGLMGRAWRKVASDAGWVLEEVPPEQAAFIIPDADYVITLDADSLLLPEYVQRLLPIMEKPENQRLAVIQTPYSAFPESPNLLERMAGATTDIQYIVHQGFTRWNATFWVGANALIRREALEHIKHIRIENGFPVAVYVQDRTVIEDTESSIDLIDRGWTLYNYPERLAYSATPPDFGALLIQRRRWANGGLLIIRKLLQYAAEAPKGVDLLTELFVRFHYLASLASASVATLLIFFYPFDNHLAIVWVPLSALPYFVLCARDLRISGYKYSDVFRVYALNLMLIPVVMGGVLKSIEQGISGAKIPFGRTPKVSGRTAAPALYCFLELALPLSFILALAWDLHSHRWMHALFSAFNGGFFLYALFQMIGIRETLVDLIAPWMVAEAKPELIRLQASEVLLPNETSQRVTMLDGLHNDDVVAEEIAFAAPTTIAGRFSS
jgi:cellulose synthase (UDP-forming)